MKTQMHDNSLAAHAANQEADTYSPREQAIIAILRNATKPMTDRDIARAGLFNDMNMVRPRINELIGKGRIEEVGTTWCVATARQVRTLRLVAAQSQGELFS